MTIGDGHYILVTRAPDGHEEHRVTRCQGIDEIYVKDHGNDSVGSTLDLDVLREKFSADEVFLQRFQAYNRADQMERQSPTVNGVQILIHKDTTFPAKTEQETATEPPQNL